MKKALVFIFALLCALTSYAQQFRLVGNLTGFATVVDDSTYNVSLSFPSDLTGNSFLPTQIADDGSYRIFFQTGRIYTVTGVANATFSDADLTLVEYGSTDGSPTGQALVFDPQGRESVPQAPIAASGASGILNAAIVSYNLQFQQGFADGDSNDLVLNPGVELESTTYTDAQALFTAIVTSLNTKVDTLYERSDSLFYQVGGVETLFAVDTGGGGSLVDGDYGDVTVSGSGTVITINGQAVTFAKLQDIPENTFVGRDETGTGSAETLTPAEARTLLNVEDGATADQTATDVPITDAGAYYTGTDVEAALQEVADTLTDLRTDLSGIASGAADGVATAGAYDEPNEEIDVTVAAPGADFSIDVSSLASDSELGDSTAQVRSEIPTTASDLPIIDAGGYYTTSDVESALQEEAVNRTALDQLVGDLITLSGVPITSQDLGTFTGTTISDNNDVKGALQELETAVESAGSVSSTEVVTSALSYTVSADNQNTIINSDVTSNDVLIVLPDPKEAYGNIVDVYHNGASELGVTLVRAEQDSLQVIDLTGNDTTQFVFIADLEYAVRFISKKSTFYPDSAYWVAEPINETLQRVGDDIVLSQKQSVSLNDFAKSVDVPTATSELINDSGFLTSSVFRTNLQALKDSSEYTPGGEVFLTESEARYNVKYALGELETEDNYFSVKLNEPSSGAENLISWSENLEKGEGIAPTPGQWEYYGSGVDLSILPDAVDGPIGNGDKADGVVRNGGSNTFRARLTDTIFAGEQYYLSFWFRAGTNTPTSGVSLRNYTFFNHRTNATATTLQTTALNTSDTTWRLYQFPLSISATDLDSVSFQAQFFGTNVFDTIYTTRWSITRESDYSYYKTTKNSIKKGVLWATIETDKGVLNFNALPDEIVGQVKNPGRRFQYAHDYCFETKNCNVIYIEPEGLTVTDTTIILKDNIGIESTFLGDVNENRLKATITFDLNNPNLNGFFVIPDTANAKVEPVGAGLKNLNINVVSPMKTVLDMGSTISSTVDNVTMHLDSFALHGIRMGGEEWPGYDGELSPLGNNVFRTRIFNATDAAILVEGGTLNYIDQSQMHRSGKGITVRDNATVTLLNSWIEKAEGLAIDVESASKFTFSGGYFEGQNRGGIDTVGMRFHNVKVLTFEDNTVSNAGIEVDAYIELDSVEQFNVIGNRYAGPNGMEVLDYTPGITCTNRYGNSYFAVGFTPPAPTFCDVSLVNPSIESGFLDTAFISSAEYRDTSVLANFVLVGKTNYVAHSEAIDNANSTYSINPGRITVTQNDATNPIDGALNAERLTLTADLDAKLVTITPTGITFNPGEEYNLSFWLEPGSEAFNDNLTITFEADKNVIIESGFDATVKDWQLVDVVVRPTVVDTEVAIQLNGDASDYCWISGVQITEGRYRADYAKTTGTVTAATPKITGDLIIDGDLTVTGTLTAPNTSIRSIYNPSGFLPDNGTYVNSDGAGFEVLADGIDIRGVEVTVNGTPISVRTQDTLFIPIYAHPHDETVVTGSADYRGWRVPADLNGAKIEAIQYSFDTPGDDTVNIQLTNGTVNIAGSTIPIAGYFENTAVTQTLTTGEKWTPSVSTINGTGHEGLMVNLMIVR